MIVKASAASLVMGGAVWLVMVALLERFGLETLGAQASVAIGAALAGGIVYALCASVLRIPEWMALSSAVRRRFGVW